MLECSLAVDLNHQSKAHPIVLCENLLSSIRKGAKTIPHDDSVILRTQNGISKTVLSIIDSVPNFCTQNLLEPTQSEVIKSTRFKILKHISSFKNLCKKLSKHVRS